MNSLGRFLLHWLPLAWTTVCAVLLIRLGGPQSRGAEYVGAVLLLALGLAFSLNRRHQSGTNKELTLKETLKNREK